MLLPLSSLGLLLLPGSFVIFESEQVQPSLSDYYKDEPNPGYEPEKKRPIEPITGIPVTVPISQRGILSVVAAIYPTSLHISSSGHARDINSHGKFLD